MPELILNQKVEIEKTTDNHQEYYPSYIVALEADTISLAAPLARGHF
ncbi:MAG TPA: flagellar brake protein, partial [Firmicutes bacterium]|nr:flagellar brake protein [Bacillota bacterium]